MKKTKIYSAILFALLLAAVPASAEVYDWSQTPATNNTADTASDVQWSEGMAPSDVNDSARAMMAELRKFLDDIGASATSSTLVTSAGTSTAYTLATEGSADNLENGRMVCFKVDESNGAAPTINVDSLGAKEILIADGVALTGGEMVANTIQCLSYSVPSDGAAGAWHMRNRFITVEAGGGLENDGVTGALQRSALTGDVAASAGSNTTVIQPGAVDYAMMQDVSATDRFLGRDTSGSGDVEEITGAAAYLMTHGADPNADRISFWDDSDSAPDYLAPDSTLTISGNTLSRAALTGDVTTSTNAATIAADAVALTTDTTGNYVATITETASGIDGSCASEACAGSLSFDPTEVNSGTWGAGSFTAFTYNSGATDPVQTFGSGSVDWSAITYYGLDNQAALRLYEGDGGGSNYIDTKAPATLAQNRTCTLEDDATPYDSCVTPPSGIADSDKGDITTSSSATVWTVDNDAITYAKLQNITATDRLLGRDSASAGDVEEIAVSGGLEFTGGLGLHIADGGVTLAKLGSDVHQMPIGTVFAFAGTSCPTKSVAAYGQELNDTTYAALLAVIGTTYGAGGVSTFNAPDLRGRVALGEDDMGGVSADRVIDAGSQSLNGDTLGDTGGEEVHQMTTSEVKEHTHTGPSHTHTGPSHTHTTSTFFNDTSDNGSHDHSYPNAGGDSTVSRGTGSNFDFANINSGTTGSSGTHDHDVDFTDYSTDASGTGATGASGTGATGSFGSTTPFNQMQPSIVLMQCIYTGV
jgi:microcystin-dependent protein